MRSVASEGNDGAGHASVGASARTWDVTPDLLATFDMEGVLRRANPAWAAVLGRASEDVVGRSFRELTHPDDLESTLGAFARLTVDDEPLLRFENRYRHADGTWRRLSWVAVPEGGLLHCSARDVTDERARDAELAERDLLWRSSSDLYVVIGLDGTYRTLNPAWSGELGHDPAALVGIAYDALAHPDDLAATRERFAASRRGDRTADFEMRVRAADGGWHWYAWTVFREGERVLGIGRNVEERRRREAELASAEEALRQAQKLEMIGRLTGGVAHDFNNLLMGIRSSLELLEERLPADDVQGRALVGDALSGAARGASLTQRMLAFARRQDLAPAAVDVGGLVEGMAELLARSLGPGVRVDTDLAPGTAAALVDADQLELAVLNLAMNARDAMDGAGELRVSVGDAGAAADAPAPGHASAPGRYVRVEIADTGHGMDAETLRRAVEPFFTTKGVGDGTGLGLSMVQGLAEQSGGRLELRSEPGAGTAAELLLPAAGRAADASSRSAPAAAAAAAAGPGGRRRILVVDDDELVLRGLSGILSRLGHEVHRAASGAAALRVLARHDEIDLLVTDQLMPGMTGAELAAAVRRRRPELPIILATGYAELEGVDESLFAARLVKPFDRARLESAVVGAPVRADDRRPVR